MSRLKNTFMANFCIIYFHLQVVKYIYKHYCTSILFIKQCCLFDSTHRPAHPRQLLLVHLLTGAGVFDLFLGKNSLWLLVLRLALRWRLVDPGVQVQTAQTNSVTLHWSRLTETYTLQQIMLLDHNGMNKCYEF